MRWTRKQYLGLMTFGDFPRPMFIEPFGPLKNLEDQWRAQGVPEDEINMVAFDFDYVQTAGVGGNCHTIDLPPVELISEDKHIRITRDGLGRTMQLDKRTATIALPMNYPVATMDDWLKFKPHFAWREDRVDPATIDQARAAQAQGKLTRAGIPGAYDTLRDLMGEEMVAYAGIDQPELVHDILDTLRDTAMRVLDRCSSEIVIDQLSVHEDMAGRSGPMFGPSQMQEWVRPYFRPIWDMLADRGTQIFDMDTDGNVNAILGDLIDCGLNHLHPMEPAAGMDIVATRKQYGQKLTFNGGLDKFAVMKGPDAIDAELDRKLVPELVEQGGIAFGLDHRIPDGTPIEHYRYYVKAVRQRLDLPPLDGSRKGWQRMAM